MRYLVGFFIAFAVLMSEKVQGGGITIHVKIQDLTHDTIWFGKTFGRKPVIEKAFVRAPDGSFKIVLNNGVSPGFYAIFFRDSRQEKLNYFHVAMEKGQSDFQVSCSADDVFGTLRFSGNEECKKYHQYRNTLGTYFADYLKYIDNYRYRPDEQNYTLIAAKQHQIVEYQQKFLAKNKKGLTARIAAMTVIPSAPKTGNQTTDRQTRWQLFTQQYLKNWQPGDSLFWSTTMGIDWLDHYIIGLWDDEKMDAALPTEDALKKLSGYPVHYTYYLEYLLKHFGSTSRFDLDRVYVHLTRKYLEKADKNLLGEEAYYRHVNLANGINRLMTGTYLPDLRFYDEKNYDRHVYDLDATYTLLVFWNPECRQCSKQLSELALLYPEYKSQGLKVITICSNIEEAAVKCWEARDQMALPSAWYYWADPKATSRFQLIYNIYSYPSMYLLDQNHKIVFRVRGEMMENELAMLFQKHLKKM